MVGVTTIERVAGRTGGCAFRPASGGLTGRNPQDDTSWLGNQKPAGRGRGLCVFGILWKQSSLTVTMELPLESLVLVLVPNGTQVQVDSAGAASEARES
jgi:hypothetical protein